MTFLRQSHVVDFKRVQSEPIFTALRKQRGPFHQKGSLPYMYEVFFVAKTGKFSEIFPGGIHKPRGKLIVHKPYLVKVSPKG